MHFGNFSKYWLPVILWAFVILIVSVSRGESVAAVSGGIPFASAVAHFGEFLVLGFLINRALRAHDFSKSTKIFFSAAFLCFVYSAFTEILQIYIPGRFFAYEDILMNNVGVLVGLSKSVNFCDYVRSTGAFRFIKRAKQEKVLSHHTDTCLIPKYFRHNNRIHEKA